MKKLGLNYFLTAAIVCFSSYAYGQDEKVVNFSKTITAEDLKKHLSVLASDEYEGRETGEKGQKMAAEYIVNHFKAIGLAGMTKNEKNPYLQTFNLIEQKWVSVSIENGDKKAAFPEKIFLMNGLSKSSIDKKSEFVFLGYGIETEEYNDYKKTKVKGKIVLIAAGEPKDKDGKAIITSKNKEYLNNNFKIKKAIQNGAKGVCLVYETDELFGNIAKMYGSYFSEPKLALPAKDSETGKPIFFISPSGAADILNISTEKFTAALTKIAETKKSTAGSLKSKAIIRAKSEEKEVPTENVLGFLEGTDLKDEVLVITSHYDHLGIVNGEINNGADDDGSGTSALLELAQAFAIAAKDGNKPRRSILFMAFTGEEKGLLGSEYYSENPIFPIKNTIADLNIDMIGRMDLKHENDPDYVYIIGSDMLSSEMHKLSEETQKKYAPEVKLDYRYNDKDDPNQFYYRSDHYNFAKFDIPVIFYFTGVHDDYHRPTDDVEKIHFPKMEKISRLVFSTAWQLANGEKRPFVDKPTLK